MSITYHTMLFSMKTERQQNVESYLMLPPETKTVYLLVAVPFVACITTQPCICPHPLSYAQKAGMIADVEMFLQIKLAPKEQDAHRYL